MSLFQTQTASAAAAALDPNKHVRFSLGMVLGADDLEQEFAYVANLPQWLARETIGYGTVCGLRVSIDMDSVGPCITVDPGVAVTPRGQLVRVSLAQCADINAWLDSNREEVNRQIGSPVSDRLTLYVILCYRACPTDSVPIPGEPCRDETETMVDSRWQDDFELRLALHPPEQTEEDAVRSFVAWLSQIAITDEPTSFASLEEFLELLRTSAPMLEAPWSSPPPLSPPGSPLETHHINTVDACEYLRAAFRVWVTELRPRWRGYLHYTVREGDRLASIAAKFNTSEVFLAELNEVSDDTLRAGQVLNIPKMFCDGMPPDEECLLLAELDVPLVGGQADVMSNENIHEERRPFLIHLRLLQEWMLCGPKRTDGGSAASPASIVVEELTFGQPSGVGSLVDQYALADHTHGTPPLPELPVSLEPGDTVVGETTFGQGSNPGTTLQYSRANHTHGTPALPPLPPALEPSNTVVSETTFGQLANAGTASQYSRADHTHGTPISEGSGDFVQHPPDLPPYFIVAAGIVNSDGGSRLPVYNGLTAQNLGGGELLLRFDGYEDPDRRFLYIVKAMPALNPDFPDFLDFMSLTINFLYFRDGIHLLVTRLGERVENLEQFEFMIEISQYFFELGVRPVLPFRVMAERPLGNRNTADVDELRALPEVSPELTDRPLVNLNTASVDELRRLPRIGPALASRIVEARKKRRGGFKSLRDLLKVEGIGEDLLGVIEPFVTISRK